MKNVYLGNNTVPILIEHGEAAANDLLVCLFFGSHAFEHGAKFVKVNLAIAIGVNFVD